MWGAGCNAELREALFKSLFNELIATSLAHYHLTLAGDGGVSSAVEGEMIWIEAKRQNWVRVGLDDILKWEN